MCHTFTCLFFFFVCLFHVKHSDVVCVKLVALSAVRRHYAVVLCIPGSRGVILTRHVWYVYVQYVVGVKGGGYGQQQLRVCVCVCQGHDSKLVFAYQQLRNSGLLRKLKLSLSLSSSHQQRLPWLCRCWPLPFAACTYSQWNCVYA